MSVCFHSGHGSEYIQVDLVLLERRIIQRNSKLLRRETIFSERQITTPSSAVPLGNNTAFFGRLPRAAASTYKHIHYPEQELC